MDSNIVYDKFRKQLTNVHAMTVFTVSLFEIVGYIVLIITGVEEFSVQNRYLWVGVVLPIVVNVVTHLAARIIINLSDARRETKNLTIVVAALVTSFVVAVIHKEYIITSCAFVFPMILSAIFNEKKLLNLSFFSSLFILLSVGFAFEIDASATLVSRLNLFVLVAFAIVSYFCGLISISFSKFNYITIKEQAEKNNKLRDDVLRDQMTGLYNHSAFLNRLNLLVEEENAGSFCLAMIDIDDFKKVNDTYGHDCGDDVLIFMADVLRMHCKRMDVPYRYGGEEFAIIFEQKTMDEACELLNDILQYVREHRFDFSDASITFSAGLSEYVPGITGDRLFELADRTLYRAKQEGKNRVLKSII